MSSTTYSVPNGGPVSDTPEVTQDPMSPTTPAYLQALIDERTALDETIRATHAAAKDLRAANAEARAITRLDRQAVRELATSLATEACRKVLGTALSDKAIQKLVVTNVRQVAREIIRDEFQEEFEQAETELDDQIEAVISRLAHVVEVWRVKDDISAAEISVLLRKCGEVNVPTAEVVQEMRKRGGS